jgi:mono/diheme cytochrome c family protein
VLAGVWLVMLVSAGSSRAQGVSFGSPGRVPREHDSDIGAKSTGDPALDYVLHCQGCHQAGGLGLPGAVPELKDSVARLATLPGGREYLSRVPGVAQSQLDDAAIAALLNWLLPHFDAGHMPADFRPFTAEEVAPLRKRPLVNASVVRAALER